MQGRLCILNYQYDLYYITFSCVLSSSFFIRYRLILNVTDHSSVSSKFLLFDGIAKELLTKGAAELAKEVAHVMISYIWTSMLTYVVSWFYTRDFIIYVVIVVLQIEEDVLPSDLQALIGKRILFKIRIAEENLKSRYKPFRVEKFSTSDDLIKKFASKYCGKV